MKIQEAREMAIRIPELRKKNDNKTHSSGTTGIRFNEWRFSHITCSKFVGQPIFYMKDTNVSNFI